MVSSGLAKEMNYLIREITYFYSPKSDGSNNGIVYNITSDDIQSIFKTYPEVKNKFILNVPAKLTEKGK